MSGRSLILAVLCFLIFSCGEKQDRKEKRIQLLKVGMDTGSKLYLNTLLNEIRTNPKWDKNTVDSIYEFRRDTILNNLRK